MPYGLTMKIYRITFVKNNIASISPAEGKHFFTGESYYYEHSGSLVFALVKAKDETEANKKAV